MRKLVAFVSLAVAGLSGAVVAGQHFAQRPCVPGEVSTERWEPESDLADLGEYEAIHWTCTKFTVPEYQLVVNLRADDARESGAKIEATLQARDPRNRPPADAVNPGGVPSVWPALAEWVPSDARWLHDVDYDATLHLAQWRVTYVDVEHTIAVLTFGDD